MYIRTKDEILKALDTDYMCGVKVYHTEKGMITEKLVVKTADNLAELCDEFVVASNTPLVIMKPRIQNMEFEEISQSYVKSKKNSIVYGAIWTDKGLVYVAKLDNKGELQLL